MYCALVSMDVLLLWLIYVKQTKFKLSKQKLGMMGTVFQVFAPKQDITLLRLDPGGGDCARTGFGHL